MSKSKYSPEVRERAVRMVTEHRADYPSQWAATQSIAAKIGCTPQTLDNWVKKAQSEQTEHASPVLMLNEYASWNVKIES